jgi:hypothetical protein
MLLQIREFIQRAQVVSTQQLAREFSMDEDALQAILEIWVKKKVIELCPQNITCQSSCMRCKPRAPMYYRACLS